MRHLILRDRRGDVIGHTLIDAEDYNFLNHWTWRLSSHGYAVRNERRDGKKCTVYLHRVLLDPPNGMVVDHINRNPLDNRRANLRLASLSENNANSSRRPSRTGYRGVYPHSQSGKFVAQISVSGQIKSLGLHDTAEAAALAYDRAARATRGAYARLNFPNPQPKNTLNASPQEALSWSETSMHPSQVIISQMNVPSSHIQGRVTENTLQGKRVSAGTNEFDREGMAEGVRSNFSCSRTSCPS